MEWPLTVPDGVDTNTVAGVVVPESCLSDIDETVLRAVVDVLKAHGITQYRVSPVGGMHVRIGCRRPDRVIEAVCTDLASAGGGLSEHGIHHGFYRFRTDLTE